MYLFGYKNRFNCIYYTFSGTKFILKPKNTYKIASVLMFICGEYGTTTLQNPIIHKPSIFIQKVNKINALKRLQNKKALNEFE